SPHAHARGGDPGSVTGLRARKVVWGPPPRSETWGDRDPAWVNGERRRRWDQRKEGRRLRPELTPPPLDSPSSWVTESPHLACSSAARAGMDRSTRKSPSRP